MSSTEPLSGEDLAHCSEYSTQSPQLSLDTRNEIEELMLDVPPLEKVFTVQDKIGSGTFSSVYVASLKEHSNIKQQFALKHIIPTSHPSRIENELRCLQEIGGKDNVIEVKACVREKDHVVIVMPYFPHEKFQDYVQQLRPKEVKEYMKNLLLSLRRVHEVDIIHRDVKPSNFLYNRSLKKFALVDFGLAQRSPVPQQKTSPQEKEKCEQNSVKKFCNVDTKVLSPRKRKLESIMDRENIPESPRKRKNSNASPLSNKSSPNVFHKNEISSTEKNTVEKKTLQLIDQNTLPCPLKASYSKSLKSPRRMILEKQALEQQVMPSNSKENNTPADSEAKTVPALSTQSTGRRTVVVQRNGKSMYRTIPPSSCGCFSRPMVCNFCMARGGERAPRAGTPGFRAPEVLMKCPDQSTAVDIWSAGVIFLSLLSGRYPFFKAADDMTALAQIINIFGTENMINSAKTYGKALLSSPTQPGMELKSMCERLRGSQQSPRANNKNSKSPAKNIIFPPEAYDLLSKLMSTNPSSRITARDALRHPYFME